MPIQHGHRSHDVTKDLHQLLTLMFGLTSVNRLRAPICPVAVQDKPAGDGHCTPFFGQKSASTEWTEATPTFCIIGICGIGLQMDRKISNRTSQTQVAKASGKYGATPFCKASAWLEPSAPSLALESSPLAQASKQTNQTSTKRVGPRFT